MGRSTGRGLHAHVDCFRVADDTAAMSDELLSLAPAELAYGQITVAEPCWIFPLDGFDCLLQLVLTQI